MAIPLFTGERTEKESELLDKRYKQVIDALQKTAPEGAIIPEKIQAAREKERALRESDGALAPAGLLDPIEFLPDIMGVGAIGAALGSMAIKKQAQRAAPSAAGFTSKLEDVIRQKMGGKATAQEIGAMVKQAGVKQEELDDIGFEQWLQSFENNLFEKQKMSSLEPSTSVQTPKIQKEDVLNYLQAERPELKEIKYGVMPEQYKKVSEEFVLLGQEKENYETYLKLFHTPEYVSGIKDEIQRSLNTNTDISDLITDRSYAYGKNLYLKASESGSNMTFEQAQGVIRNYITTLNQRKNLATALQSYAKNYPEPRWKRYSLSNQGIGENYRELVFSLTPKDSQKKSFATAHWANIKNPVYHIRAQDLVDSQGSKLLNVDEIQSDLHQLGQRLGYKKRDLSNEERSLITDLLYNHGFKYSETFSDEDLIKYSLYLGDEEFKKVIPILKEAGMAVDLPFKKSWHEQGMRRMIREAVESGKDGLSWTAGSVQAKRAGQGLEEIESITYDPSANFLEAVRQGESEPIAFQAGLQELNRYVGSENAKKIKAAVAIKKQERAKWIERQQKQDDYALEKFRAWFRPELERQRGPVSDEVFERFYKYAVETIKDGDVNNPYRIQLKEQLSNAGLTPIQISDLINKRIKNPPSLDVEIPVEGGSFGGEGMKKFYDEKLVNFMRDEAKRLGGTISQTTVIGKDGIEYPLWKFTFGPKTKDLLQEKGMPLYQVPTAIGLGELMRQYKQQQEQSNER